MHQLVVVNGLRFTQVPVESKLPHCSVLGKVLFLFYINNLPSKLISTRLFPNDTQCHKLPCMIQIQADFEENIDNMANWTDNRKCPPTMINIKHFVSQDVETPYDPITNITQKSQKHNSDKVFWHHNSI